MKFPILVTLVVCLPAFADQPPLDCSKKSLAQAVASVKSEGETITFTGVCAGPLAITTGGLSLKGVGTAVIDGGGQNAVTIAGVHGVSLASLEVRNGASGILGTNGAHFSLTGVTSHDNQVFGISLQTSSSAELTDVSVHHNHLHGLDLQTGSAAEVRGTLSATNNSVFGINVNGSSITFARATVTANNNAVGIQIATNANAFLNDRFTTLNTNANLATGLTVVSGAHLVSFGGIINAAGNPFVGVSVNSKAGLDLDAGAVLNATANGDGVTLQEGSVMTVFNNPMFSQVGTPSTLNTQNNTKNGIVVKTGSVLTLSNVAKITSLANQQRGLLADNNATLTLINTTLMSNLAGDLLMTFGVTVDAPSVTAGTYACDGTVQARGTLTCPH